MLRHAITSFDCCDARSKTSSRTGPRRSEQREVQEAINTVTRLPGKFAKRESPSWTEHCASESILGFGDFAVAQTELHLTKRGNRASLRRLSLIDAARRRRSADYRSARTVPRTSRSRLHSLRSARSRAAPRSTAASRRKQTLGGLGPQAFKRCSQ
jgi:hypothetical protein